MCILPLCSRLLEDELNFNAPRTKSLTDERIKGHERKMSLQPLSQYEIYLFRGLAQQLEIFNRSLSKMPENGANFSF